MRIAILGAGGVGSVLAGFLAQGKQDVIVVSRGEHLKAMREHGLTVDGAARAHGTPALVEHGSELKDVDLLLLITKTYDTAEALAGVDPRQIGMVASLQNGIVKDKVLEEHFGADKVIGCTTMVGGERTSPGHVRCMIFGDTYFGEFSGALTPRLTTIGDTFRAAALNVQLTNKIQSLEWTKQVLQASNAPLAAITRQPLHELYLGAAGELYYEIVLESAAVPTALGIELDAEQAWGGPIKELLTLSREDGLRLVHQWAQVLIDRGATNVRVSMQQDVMAGRRTEIEETAGYVVREARRLGIQTPYLDFACQAVRALTENSRGRS